MFLLTQSQFGKVTTIIRKQKELIIKNGLPTEPIIILDLNGTYELIEGWHRTIQLFSLFPKGFEYPNVYVGKANKSIYM
jgi:hypothetical protein